jgi:hypothetical protein
VWFLPALAIGPSTVALPIVVVDDLACAAIVCSASFGFAGSATGATFGFFSGGCQISAQDNGSHVSTVYGPSFGHAIIQHDAIASARLGSCLRE